MLEARYFSDVRLHDRQDEAKDALLAFFEEFSKIEPEPDIPPDTLRDWQYPYVWFFADYYTFFINLLLGVKEAQSKRYSAVCNEILTVAFRERNALYQNRVYSALMRLYHDFLED